MLKVIQQLQNDGRTYGCYAMAIYDTPDEFTIERLTPYTFPAIGLDRRINNVRV